MHKRNGKGQSQVINSILYTFILSLTGLWNTLHVPGATHKWHILMSAVSPLLKTFTLPVEACKIISQWGTRTQRHQKNRRRKGNGEMSLCNLNICLFGLLLQKLSTCVNGIALIPSSHPPFPSFTPPPCGLHIFPIRRMTITWKFSSVSHLICISTYLHAKLLEKAQDTLPGLCLSLYWKVFVSMQVDREWMLCADNNVVAGSLK